VGIRILWHQGRLSCIHRPEWGTLAHGKKKGIGTIWPKVAGCNQKILIFRCFSQR
jgi:hypothetical protein